MRCPECKFEANLQEFEEGEVYCSDCGSHEARKCPQCEKMIDMVYYDGEE